MFLAKSEFILESKGTVNVVLSDLELHTLVTLASSNTSIWEAIKEMLPF